jgi:hypothetical protein
MIDVDGQSFFLLLSLSFVAAELSLFGVSLFDEELSLSSLRLPGTAVEDLERWSVT